MPLIYLGLIFLVFLSFTDFKMVRIGVFALIIAAICIKRFPFQSCVAFTIVCGLLLNFSSRGIIIGSSQEIGRIQRESLTAQFREQASRVGAERSGGEFSVHAPVIRSNLLENLGIVVITSRHFLGFWNIKANRLIMRTPDLGFEASIPWEGR